MTTSNSNKTRINQDLLHSDLQAAAVIESEQDQHRFRLLSELIPQQIWTARPDGNLDYVNQRVLDFFGRTPEQVLGLEWLHLIHPEDLPECTECWQHSLATGDPYEVEFRLQLPDKDYRWHLARAVARRNQQGQIIGWYGTNTDIHDRKQTEQALRESEERFRNLIETSSDWVWEVDHNGVYTYASPKSREIFGLEPAEILGKTPFDLMPEDEAQRVAEVFGPIAAAREPLRNLENTNRHRDGSLVVLETSGTPFFGADGTFRGYRGIDRDITDRKQAEKARRKSDQRYESILDSLNDIVWSISAVNFDTLYLNPAAERIYGYPRSRFFEDAGLWFRMIHPEDREKVQQFAGAVRANGSQELEYRIMRADGEVRWLSDRARATYDPEGNPIRLDGVVSDITDRKQAEAALQQANNELEHRVQQRTAELTTANAALQAEIAERRQVQSALQESQRRLASLINVSYG